MTLNKLSEYGHGFQIKVIALLLTEKKFLDNVLKPLHTNGWWISSYRIIKNTIRILPWRFFMVR